MSKLIKKQVDDINYMRKEV